MYCARHLQPSIGHSLPKGPTSPALGVSSPTREEGSSKPVATSSQASPWAAMPDIKEPIVKHPEAAYAPITLPTKTPGADMGSLPEDILLLQGDEQCHWTLTYDQGIPRCPSKETSVGL